MKFLNQILNKYFYDTKTTKDVCEDAKKEIAKEASNPGNNGFLMNQAGLENFESLVCGFQTNFLSFGVILLCTLFKF